MDGLAIEEGMTVMTKFEPDCNGLSRVCNDARWYLVDCSGRQVGASYSFIHECDNGLYKVEKGSRKNLMRADGSLVMRAWHHEVGNVCKGMFIFSNIVRKSKHNPHVRHIYGIGHVSGLVLFPMIFNAAQWLKDNCAIYVEIDEKPFLIDRAAAFMICRANICQADWWWTIPKNSSEKSTISPSPD